LPIASLSKDARFFPAKNLALLFSDFPPLSAVDQAKSLKKAFENEVIDNC